MRGRGSVQISRASSFQGLRGELDGLNGERVRRELTQALEGFFVGSSTLLEELVRSWGIRRRRFRSKSGDPALRCRSPACSRVQS